jgi:hypothetical protein
LRTFLTFSSGLARVVDRVVVGLEFLREMEEKMVKIKYNLKVDQKRKNIYVEKRRMHK